MTQDDRILLNSVKGQLLAWEDHIQNLYAHVRKLELLILKQHEERPTSELEFIELRLRALEDKIKDLDKARGEVKDGLKYLLGIVTPLTELLVENVEL